MKYRKTQRFGWHDVLSRDDGASVLVCVSRMASGAISVTCDALRTFRTLDGHRLVLLATADRQTLVPVDEIPEDQPVIDGSSGRPDYHRLEEWEIDQMESLEVDAALAKIVDSLTRFRTPI